MSAETVARPIIFSAPMVRALIEGRKTQTRRVLKNVPPAPSHDAVVHPNPKRAAPYFDSYRNAKRSPFNPEGMSRNWCWWTRDDRQCLPTVNVGYEPGDLLWVRENWHAAHSEDRTKPRDFTPDFGIAYAATYSYAETGIVGKLRPSIFMPRWASRLTLRVSAVKVERLQKISPDDAWNEGVERHSRKVRQMWLFGADAAEREEIYKRACVWEFEDLWNSIHGPDAWDANPFVVAITFSVIKANVDSSLAVPRAAE